MHDIKLGMYEVEVGQGPVVLDLDGLLIISDDTSDEFKKQPSLYAYVAMLAARAEAVWLDAKRQLEDAEATASKRIRKTFALRDEKITETRIAEEVKMDKGYSDAVEYELAVHEQFLILRVLSNSMDMRAQMLISLGAQLRAEANQTGMLIKETKDKLTAIRQQSRKEGAIVGVSGDAKLALRQVKQATTRKLGFSGSEVLYGTDPKDIPF